MLIVHISCLVCDVAIWPFVCASFPLCILCCMLHILLCNDIALFRYRSQGHSSVTRTKTKNNQDLKKLTCSWRKCVCVTLQDLSLTLLWTYIYTYDQLTARHTHTNLTLCNKKPKVYSITLGNLYVNSS